MGKHLQSKQRRTVLKPPAPSAKVVKLLQKGRAKHLRQKERSRTGRKGTCGAAGCTRTLILGLEPRKAHTVRSLTLTEPPHDTTMCHQDATRMVWTHTVVSANKTSISGAVRDLPLTFMAKTVLSRLSLTDTALALNFGTMFLPQRTPPNQASAPNVPTCGWRSSCACCRRP